MLAIKFIPNLLSEEGRTTVSLEYCAGWPVRRYLETSGLEHKDLRIVVTGKRIEEKDLDAHIPKNGDEILILPAIEEPISISIITFAVIGAFLDPVAWIGWGLVIGAMIGAAIGIAINSATNKPNVPSYGNAGDLGASSSLEQGSPTYGWDGIQTTMTVGTPIPIVYGEHRVGGNVINQFVRTDGDKQYLNMLLSLSEGEIDGISSVEINENPSENFSGITLTTDRLGTNDQASIANFHDLHDIHTVNAMLTKDSPYTHTTVRTDVEAFELKFTLGGGLYQASSSGSINAWEVKYKVEYKLHSEESYTDLGETTISDKSRTAIFRVFRKSGLTAGQYDIRVTRTSDDSSLDPLMQGDIQLSYVDEISTERLNYPNVALLGIEALATDQLSGAAPNVTCVVKGRKVSVPKILDEEGGEEVDWDDYYYDPETSEWKLFSDDSVLYWDGTTYVDRWSANPVWCLRDLLTASRYGLGEYISSDLITVSEWLEMAKYCEERVSDGDGGWEKRFRMDVVIDSQTRALDLLTQLCATFRAFVFYSSGAIKIKIDKEEEPVQLFGMGNIIKSSFVQSWKSMRERYNTVEITFNDVEKNYKQEIVSVIDEEAYAANEPIRKKEIRLFCTRVSQAIREGRYALNVARGINRTVKLKAGIDAIACQAGDVINVSHDVPQWGFSGRVIEDSSNSTTHVAIDRPATIEAGKTYKLRVRFSDDSQEERTVTTGAGSASSLDVSPAFSATPQAFDVFSFGEENKVVAPYRIIALRRSGDSEVEIDALEYDEDVFDTDTVYLPDSNYSSLTISVPAVTDLSLTERLVKLSDGTIENVIDVWFNKPLESTEVLAFSRAKIYLSDDSGASYSLVGETSGRHFAIQGNLTDGIEYKVRVVSVSFNGIERSAASCPTATIQLVGKSAYPSDVESFLVRQSRDRMYFGWTAVDDVDLLGYEIRYGESWDAGDILATQIKATSFISLNLRTGSSQKYFIKAIDTTGNYSENATQATVTIDNIPFTNVIETWQEETAWGGTKTDTEKVDDNLELSSGELTGTYETDVADVGYVATFKIGIETVVTVSGDTTLQDYGEDTLDSFPDSMRLSGMELSGAVSFQIKTSDDNVTWSDYEPYQTGDYKCRYFKILMTLTRQSTAQDLECSTFDYYADLPDVDEFGAGEVTVAADGCEITFTKTFHEAPSVNIDILDGDAYVHKFSSAPSTTGFTVKLYELDGTAATGNFRYHAHGV